MGTISKSLNLLNFLSQEHPEIELTEFRKLSGQDKATVHRHLTQLTDSGFLEQNLTSRDYRLGPAILWLAAPREAPFPTRRAVAPIVERMSEDLGELVHVTLLSGTEMSPLFHHDAKIHGTRVYLDESEMLPLYATSSGVCLLAFAQVELLDKLLAEPLQRWTENTNTDPEALKATVGDARDKGIGHVDQGGEVDVCSYAAPVFGIGEHAIGSLAVAIPVSRKTDALEARIHEVLRSGTVAVTDGLGGVFPQSLARKWQNSCF